MTRARLVLRLERDDDGYPPVEFERLWIEKIDDSTAIVDNIPFFSRDVALGDLVAFEEVGDELRYVATVKRSGNSLVRVVYYSPTDPTELRRRIEELGCETELDAAHSLIAISVPLGDHLARLQAFLTSSEAHGDLGYEEAILVTLPQPEL
jgi:Domain of unknown function (DUF4265)